MTPAQCLRVAGALVLLIAAGPTRAADEPSHGSPADPGAIAKGRAVFDNYGCSSCHTLADAGATGTVGPSFDGDANLSEAFAIERVTNGQGQMPAFGGSMSPEEIKAVAAYVVHAARK